MIPTFTKLFAISSAAKSSFGCFSKFKILFSLAIVSSAKVSVSFGESEKYADSAPENKADSNRSNKITALRTMTVLSKCMAEMNKGGGAECVIKMEVNRRFDCLNLQF